MAHLLSCCLLDEASTADDTGHSDRVGKGMHTQVGEHCVKDTTEEEESTLLYKILTITLTSPSSGYYWGVREG